MVRTLLKSALREIRQSLGRYLAILAIIALGVGFFSGLRLCQPAMMATGIDYVTQYKLFDFQLMSTLGYTEEDVAAFAALDGVSGAWGSVYTDFLMEAGDEEVVITARALTEGVNDPELAAGRMPEAANECLGDARYFTEEDLGTQVAVSPNNDEDTLDLLAYDSYTLVGLMHSPYYLNYERGTSSIGSGSVTAFIYLPEEGFDFEAYYEIYLTIADPAEAWSDAYDDQIDGLTDQVEDLARERADQRYDDIYDDALAEIEDAEQEIADGQKELDDALVELMASGATLVLLGMHAQRTSAATMPMFLKEISIRTGLYFTAADYREAFELICANKELFLKTITSRIPHDAKAVQDMFVKLFESGSNDECKVVIEYED